MMARHALLVLSSPVTHAKSNIGQILSAVGKNVEQKLLVHLAPSLSGKCILLTI